jgi:hypothetical protein
MYVDVIMKSIKEGKSDFMKCENKNNISKVTFYPLWFKYMCVTKLTLVDLSLCFTSLNYTWAFDYVIYTSKLVKNHFGGYLGNVRGSLKLGNALSGFSKVQS